MTLKADEERTDILLDRREIDRIVQLLGLYIWPLWSEEGWLATQPTPALSPVEAVPYDEGERLA